MMVRNSVTHLLPIKKILGLLLLFVPLMGWSVLALPTGNINWIANGSTEITNYNGGWMALLNGHTVGIGFTETKNISYIGFWFSGYSATGTITIGIFSRTTGNLIQTIGTLNPAVLNDSYIEYDFPVPPSIFEVLTTQYVGARGNGLGGGGTYLKHNYGAPNPGECTFWDHTWPDGLCDRGIDSHRVETNVGIIVNNSYQDYSWTTSDVTTPTIVIRNPSGVEVLNETVSTNGDNTIWINQRGTWTVYVLGDLMNILDSDTMLVPESYTFTATWDNTTGFTGYSQGIHYVDTTSYGDVCNILFGNPNGGSSNVIIPCMESGTYDFAPDIPGIWNVSIEVYYYDIGSWVYGPVSDITISNPVASFTSDGTVGNTPFTVQFTDTSTGTPSSWLWDFGDGNTSTEQSPIFIYNVPGLYYVNLTVCNIYGACGSDNVTAYIRAVGPPQGALILLHYDGPDGLTYFYDEYGHDFTTYGNANISTTTDKFGGSSGHFVASGDNIQAISNDIDWTTHNWTVDFWVNLSTLGDWGNQNYIFSFNSTQNTNTNNIFTYASGIWIMSNTYGSGMFFDSGMDTLTWHHIAIEQSMVGGGMEIPFGSGRYPHITMYRDGTLIGDNNAALYPPYGTPPDNILLDSIVIGSNTPSQFTTGAVQGYLDEFRVSDIVQYTTDFTPATDEYAPASIPFPTGTVSWTNATSPGDIREPFAWSGTQSPSYNVVIKDPSDIEVYNESAAASGSDTFLLDVEGYWHLYFTGMYHTIGRVLSSDTMYAGKRDPNTLILLHNNGINESTNFIDEYGHTFTSYGSVKILTTEYKFGGASGYFASIGDNIQAVADDIDYTTHNWTVDFWVNLSTIGTGDNMNYIFSFNSTQNINDFSALSYSDSGFWTLNNMMGGGWFYDPGMDTLTWHHITIEQSIVGGSGFEWPPGSGRYPHMMMYRDGTLLGDNNGAIYAPFGTPLDSIVIGSNTPYQWVYGAVQGYLDEFRVSDIVRYSSDFTPADEEYIPQSIPTGTVTWSNPTAYINTTQGYSWSAINISSPFIAIHGPDSSERYNSTVAASGLSSFTVDELGTWNVSLSGISLSDITVGNAPIPIPTPTPTLSVRSWTNQKAGDISNIVVAGILVAISAIMIGIVMKFFMTKE